MTREYVHLEPVARILRREAERRGSVEKLTSAIAAAGLMRRDSVARRVYAILHPLHVDSRTGRRVEQRYVDFGVADKILTSLDLNELWYTELADAIAVRKHVPFTCVKKRAHPCAGCGGDLDAVTDGCKACKARHYWRRRNQRSLERAA